MLIQALAYACEVVKHAYKVIVHAVASPVGSTQQARCLKSFLMICKPCVLTWQLTMHVHAACVAVSSDQQHMLLAATQILELNMLMHCA